MAAVALSDLSPPRVPDPADDLETFLVECLESIADELFARVYRPRQQIWTSASCPWCRRLREIGMEDVDCPVCEQIERARGFNRGPSRASGFHRRGNA